MKEARVCDRLAHRTPGCVADSDYPHLGIKHGIPNDIGTEARQFPDAGPYRPSAIWEFPQAFAEIDQSARDLAGRPRI